MSAACICNRRRSAAATREHRIPRFSSRVERHIWPNLARSGRNRQFFEPRGCLECRVTVAFRARVSARFSGVESRNQPRWRNWQTRMIQVHVPVMGVEVRLLSGASSSVLRLSFFCAPSCEPGKTIGKPQPRGDSPRFLKWTEFRKRKAEETAGWRPAADCAIVVL